MSFKKIYSIRAIFAVFEGVTLFLAILFVIILFALLGRQIRASYLKSQAREIDRIESTMMDYIKDNRELFTVYAGLADRGAPADLLTSFSDLYFCDSSFVLTRVVKRERSSPIFPGYDLGRSRVAEMLAKIDASRPVVSAMFRSSEDERLSVYVGARSVYGYIVGRIGTDPLQAAVRRIADYSGSIVIIATGEGYIISNSGEPLHLHILPGKRVTEVKLGGIDYLYMRKRSGALGKDIAILTPVSTVYALLGVVERRGRLFILLFALIIIAKIVGQTMLIIRPFGRFSALIRRWEPDAPPAEVPPEFLRYEEISALYRSFSDKSEQIRDAVSALRESEKLLEIQRDLGMALGSTSELAPALDAMLEAALRIDGMDSGGIYLVDEEAGFVELACSAGLSSSFLESSTRYGMDSPNARVVMEGWPVYLEGDQILVNSLGLMRGDAAAGEEFRSLAVVPIRHMGRSIACVNVASMSSPRISQGKRDALESMASMLGNVIARIRHQERVTASLREKEILLKEIHHRVKNNFQIIISLLNLQSMNIQSEELQQRFNDSRNSIRAMALIHEKLYQSDDFARIDFSAYLKTLTTELCSIYASPAKPVACRLDVERVDLPIDLAIPCSLIVNEILSNSLKYAFSPPWEGSPEILLRMTGKDDGEVKLEISDNGIGMPAGRDVGAPDSDTLGLSLIGLLARQIKATLRLDRDGGTRYTIVFRGNGQA